MALACEGCCAHPEKTSLLVTAEIRQADVQIHNTLDVFKGGYDDVGSPGDLDRHSRQLGIPEIAHG